MNAQPISVADAARICGISQQMVRRLLASGRIAGYRIGKIVWVVNPASAKAYADSRKNLSQSA